MNNSSDDRTEESTSGITRAGESGHPSEGVPGLNKIPRGTEMLVKRASVDPAFRQALIERRADVARDIGLVLTMAESVMLDTIPSAQLEKIIEHTKVSAEEREALLGRGDAAVSSAFLNESRPATFADRTRGIRPRWEDQVKDDEDPDLP